MKKRVKKFIGKFLPLGILLKFYRFVHEDIGSFNTIIATDYFIISMPKCGTTSVKQGFNKINKLVIQTHVDETGFESLSNGDILRKRKLGLREFINLRLKKNTNDIYVFSGFRDPISWYFSLAQQFNLSLNNELQNNIVDNLNTKKPWLRHLPKVQFELIKHCTKIDIFDYPFDKEKGVTVIKKGRISLVLYRLDAMKALESFIAEVEPGYTLVKGRVVEKDSYLEYVNNLKISCEHIDVLFDDTYVQYFYNTMQIEKIKNKFLYTRTAQ